MPAPTFRVDLIVRPKTGVADPQGDAVQEALGGLDYSGFRVVSVGRCLRMEVDAESEAEARATVEDMCRRLLVNPNLETFELEVSGL